MPNNDTMSNAKHTPEPWCISEGANCEYLAIVGAAPIAAPIAHISNWLPYEEQRANAARIWACVNKCAGIQDLSSAVLVPVETLGKVREALGEALADATARVIEADPYTPYCQAWTATADRYRDALRLLAALGGES